jgi:hypothetical protein
MSMSNARCKVAWGAGELPLRGLRDGQPTPPAPRFARPRCSPRTIAGGYGEAERQRAGWVEGVKGPKGGANPPRVPIPFVMLAGLAWFLILAPACSQPDASQPSLDGYWDLVSNHDNATGTTTPVASGTIVVHYNGGVVELYMSNGATKGCAQNTYTVQGTTITYGYGNPNQMAVTDTTLRLTTLQDGTPVGYSDFVRLATFSADGYGACKSGISGADAG